MAPSHPQDVDGEPLHRPLPKLQRDIGCGRISPCIATLQNQWPYLVHPSRGLVCPCACARVGTVTVKACGGVPLSFNKGLTQLLSTNY